MLRCLTPNCTNCILYPCSSALCQKRCLPRSTAHAGHSKLNHYEVLGLTPAASHSEIRNAFVKLSKETHPDRNPNDPENHVKFVRLNEAYTVLSKFQTRREYDVSLAYMIRAQKMAKSHTVGFSSAPGFGGAQPDSAPHDHPQAFRDESIWEMRDRSKDANAFYPKDSYYGIKGIRRQSNGVIAALCLVIVILGFGYFFFALQYSHKKAKEYQKQVDFRNKKTLKETRERARMNGTAKQIELFAAKHNEQLTPTQPSSTST